MHRLEYNDGIVAFEMGSPNQLSAASRNSSADEEPPLVPWGVEPSQLARPDSLNSAAQAARSAADAGKFTVPTNTDIAKSLTLNSHVHLPAQPGYS